MLNPTYFTEKILFHTVLLELNSGAGTGFIYGFTVDDDLHVPVIVTNKHVINYESNPTVRFAMHQRDAKGNLLDSIVHITHGSEWVMHPNSETDLCCTLLQPIVESAQGQGYSLYYKICPDYAVYTEDELNDMQTVNDVIMVGYPDRIIDKKHFLPIVRKGSTATHPAIDFNGKSIGMIDMSCYYGSSGSPLFIYPGITKYSKKEGVKIGYNEPKLLGIFFALLCANDEGEIFTKVPKSSLHKSSTNSETASSDEYLNLGYYIKAKELNVLRDEVFKKYESRIKR